MRSRLAAACLTGGLLAALSTPTAAVSAIPDETSVELPGGVRSAMVGDVDGDGVRELVSIRRWQNDPGRLAVEVTYVDEAGIVMFGGQALLRRGISPDDVFDAGPPPDDDGMLVVGSAEPARLLAWRVDGVERVIVAAIGTERLPGPCCLTLWEVRRDPVRGTELRLLIDTQGSASSIHAVDLDGDGTDELVIGEPPESLRPNEVQLRILRWDGTTFSKASLFLTPALGSNFAPLGNSDGRPGEELGMIAVPNEANMPALLHRISLDDGVPRTELVDIPFVGELAPLVGSDGGRILLASPGEGLRLFDWPAQGELTEVATSPQRGFPLGVLATGADARLLLRDEGIVHVLDERLDERGVIRRSAAAAQFRNSFLAPFGGPLPGGLADGRPAVVFRGRLVVPASGGAGPDGDPLSDRVVASLPGMSPIGVFGPQGAWTALAAATRFEAERSGGRLTAEAPIDPVRVTMVRTDEVLRPEADGGALEPTVSGAIPDPRSAGRPVLLARDLFAVEFTGPPGSSVALENGNPDDLRQVQIGVRGIVRLTVEAPSPATVDDEVFSARLQVVTPAGHGYITRWEVHILRVPPAVVVVAPVAPLSFSVPVRGRTDPGATVLVDSVPVAVRPDGSFDAQVLAGPIPRDVRIQVTDPVGNSAQHTLSVVGVVDFRRLPWIPVVAVLTVLAGAVLYLRVPRPRRPAARGAGDDATFEEID
jgi:hypothetical protein